MSNNSNSNSPKILNKNNNHSILPKKNKKKRNGGAIKYSTNTFTGYISQLFKKVDIYGHKINLNYMGQETYNTCPSTFISLLTIFFTLTALYPRFDAFLYNNDLIIDS